MPKRAVARFQPLQTCLVNLPLSLYSQLVGKAIRPQSLVVCLTWTGLGGSNDRHTAYVGWTGMPARVYGAALPGKGEEAVELDPVAARELGIREGVEVTIDLLRNLPAAKTVQIEPVSPDDWEIVELHAEYVEQNLLSQVRAASPNQTICVWVGKARTLVRFRIDSVEPADDIAVRLTIDTEVVVAPKTRRDPSVAAFKERHDISSGSGAERASTSTASTQAKPLSPDVERAKRQLVRVLPEKVQIPALQKLAAETTGEPAAWVAPKLFQLLIQAYPSTKVSVKVKSCPACRDSSSSGANEKQRSQNGKGDESHVSTPQNEKGKSRALPPAGPADGPAGPDSGVPVANVHLQPCFDVPAGCIWLSTQVRRILELTPTGYELLKMGKPASREATAPVNGHTESSVDGVEEKEKLSPLAGFDKQLGRATDHIRHTLFSSRGFSPGSPHRPTSGLLLCGASGSGKTAFTGRIARDAVLDPKVLTHVETVNCATLSSLRASQVSTKLEELFSRAAWHAPALVVLDNLDRLLPAEVEHIDSFHAQHISHLFLNIATKAIAERPIVVLATCKGPENLHAVVAQSHFFAERIALASPDKNARKEILEALVKEKITTFDASLAIHPDFNYTALATQTEGYLPVDLKDLINRSLQQASIRLSKSPLSSSTSPGSDSTLTLALEDVTSAQADFTPLSLRDVKLQKSEVRWEDIGGLVETRRVLRETLEWPTKYAAIFKASPLRLRSGLLLYGFPGCGKTLLASAVAKECGLNFISVKGPEILNKYIGASEKSVRDLFERASSAKPCVLFFDEFDSIAPKRGHDSTGVTDRVVNQLLTQMDGAEGLDGVYVLAATSRPDLIDPALLRPGRLDKSLLCDMPSPSDRLEIMRACSRKIALSPEVDLAEYVESTHGYSGADLQAVVYNAHLECIHASISEDKQIAEKGSDGAADDVEKRIRFLSLGGKKGVGGQANGTVMSRADRTKVEKRLEQMMESLKPKPGKVTDNTTARSQRKKTLVEPFHLDQSLRTTRPSVPKDEVRRLQRIYDDFVSARAKGGLPDGNASQEIGGRSSLM